MKPLCFLQELTLEFLLFLPPLSARCCPHHPATLRPACQLCAPGISWGSQAVIFMSFYFLPSEAKAFLPLLDMHFLKIQLSRKMSGFEARRRACWDKACEKNTAETAKGVSDRTGSRYDGEGESCPPASSQSEVQTVIQHSACSDIRLSNEKTSLMSKTPYFTS